ncbi:MAG: PEGA domain-containing protein [Patescibacteria group bacterium]
MNNAFRSVLIAIVTICIIFSVAGIIIAYGRGYRFDLRKNSLKSTGLIVAQSEPTGAQIMVDGVIKDATQATFTMPPGTYTISIVKEGFQAWTKRIIVQSEIVNKLDALLLPTNPSLTALTVNGVVSPTLSPDGSKLAYIIPDRNTNASDSAMTSTKPGIWVLDLVDKPLGLNRDARQIAKSNGINFSTATLAWSPDNKQILATFPTPSYYLFEIDTIIESPQQIFNIKTVQSDWQAIKLLREKEQFATLPSQFIAIATTSAHILSFSPDETKILYEATKSATLLPVLVPPLIGANSTPEVRKLDQGTLYIYDIKEDRNYALETTSQNIYWLPSSRHLVTVVPSKIEIIDYDGSNKRTAYAGPFWDEFAVPWASGGKLIILTNLNPTATNIHNLYVVNLK